MIRIVLKESVLIIVNQLILWATCVVNCLQRILWLPTMFLKMYSRNISTNTEKKWSIKEMPRIGKREPLLDCIWKLQELTVPYLLHQFSVCCDTVYWKEFLFQTYHYVLWLDYSQNLALKGKGQVQSAHILGKQQTLHTRFFYKPNNQGHKFIYHFSDDTKNIGELS